ncbi:Gp49 family protein [Candidatus Parabeggiatoa sp. HSG14]|uniref:Gp49 family protein n=1 Tax=Candidatus Parabeggiatoa sp. HSG14 TaxID=3055593 RepID=UPI0025A7F1E0|nr:hypothetical protein [Thiotrichales bacterium HSG14]
MKNEIAKTEYFRLGKMTVLCLLTLDNGYEVIGSVTKLITNEADEKEARGIAYQKAVYKKMESESIPLIRTVGTIPTSYSNAMLNFLTI